MNLAIVSQITKTTKMMTKGIKSFGNWKQGTAKA